MKRKCSAALFGPSRRVREPVLSPVVEWRVRVQVGVERLSRRELRGRPADRELREPVALVVVALVDWPAVKLARLPLGLVGCDPILHVGEFVERRQGNAGTLGQREVPA